MVKKIALLIALGYSVVLTTLSLISSSSIPNVGMEVSDKVLHAIAYAVLTLFWFIALKRGILFNYLFLIPLLCILYGIILEVIQGVLKTHRTADVFDILANSVGVLVITLGIFAYNKSKVKN